MGICEVGEFGMLQLGFSTNVDSSNSVQLLPSAPIFTNTMLSAVLFYT